MISEVDVKSNIQLRDKMALDKEVVEEYYKLLFEVGKTDNVLEGESKLSREITDIKSTYENAAGNTIKACQYLNNSTSAIIKERTSSSAISVGKDSAPLVAAAKQLADCFFKGDVKGCHVNIEEQIQESLSKAEDNHQRLEEFCMDTRKSMENLEYFIRTIKKQSPQANNSSSVSDIPSSFYKDVVTSSPINSNFVKK